MSDKTSSASGGIGLSWVLFLIFLVLKLTHAIDWSWWWITAPLWGSACLFVLIFLIVVLVGFIGVTFFGWR